MSTQALGKESESLLGDDVPLDPAGKRPDPIRVSTTVLGVVYLAQTLTPLRLDNDSVVYLRMAAALADGRTIEPTGLPVGYPAMVSVLDRLGLGNAFFFVLANCAFIALGLYSVWYIFGSRAEGRRTLVVPLTMLAVPVIRYLAMPLPESMFFGVSLGAVAAMTAATRNAGRVRLQFLAIAMVLTTIAITVRLVGFALVPALLWAIVARNPDMNGSDARWTPREKWLGVIALVAVSAVAALLLGDSFRKYSYEAGLKYFGSGLPHTIYVHLQGFTWIFGEVTSNLPGTKFRNLRLWFVLFGFIAIAMVLIKARLRFPRTPSGFYLASFVLMLLLWPYNALRLWAPIIPLLIGYAEIEARRAATSRKWSAFRRVYIGWLALTGIAALAYTSRITFSGSNFPKVYGLAGGLSSPDPRTGRVDTVHNHRAIELMKRYGNPLQPAVLPDPHAAANRILPPDE